eukprot:gene24648-26511_t
MSEAVEKYGLHKRFAYNVIRLTYRNSTSTSTQLGISSDEYLILSFVVVTGFISMWLSNSATAVLMVPLSKAVIQGLKTSSNPEPGSLKSIQLNNLAAAIDLTIAYAAAFGGMSTLTGTAANLALQGTLQSEFGADSTGTI